MNEKKHPFEEFLKIETKLAIIIGKFPLEIREKIWNIFYTSYLYGYDHGKIDESIGHPINE